MTDLIFAVERLVDVIDECAPLLHDHWKDVALDQDSITLDPDWDAYYALDSVGALVIITARDDGLTLVGYSVYIVTENLHYKGLMIADSDIFWLAKTHRKGTAGMRLIRYSETALASRGVHKIMSKVKTHRNVGPVFERMGYDEIERVYCKGVK